MLTLYHSPMSRSTRVMALIQELGIEDKVEVRQVTVQRRDGSGGADPANPHPEGKVPCLVHDGVEIWESSAIMLYLCDMFPKAGFGVPVGDPLRGRFLSWLAWYGDVMEPVYNLQFASVDSPVLQATFRGVPELVDRLRTALEKAPYLVGDHYTAADLLVSSTYGWMPDSTPDVPIIRDWVARCLDRPAQKATMAADQAA